MKTGWAPVGELSGAAKAATHDRAAFHALCAAGPAETAAEPLEFVYWTADGALGAIASLRTTSTGPAELGFSLGQTCEQIGQASVVLHAFAELADSLGIHELTTIVSCDRCDPLRVFREAGLAPLSSEFEGSGARVVLSVPAAHRQS